MIISSLKATRELWLIIPSPCIDHFTLAVNNIEVTGNICTCTDVFTIITTKDQSGGIYNSADRRTSDEIVLL